MSKKKRKKQLAAQAAGTPKGDASKTSATVDADPLSSRGKKTILAGAVVVAAGFAVLTRADSMGRNWAAALSPWLILGGYGVMGWGIFRDDEPSAGVAAGGEAAGAGSPSSPPSEKTT